jgi:demethylmenaquinone methyltransferase/2-methoxy-6-polyprenyl-1,4-benzoquinol methylase
MFTRIAPVYDLMNRVLSLGSDTGWRRELVRASFVTGGERVLDLCTGTGDLALMFARTGASVVGVDLSVGMLAQARRRVRRAGLSSRVSLRAEDVLKLSVPAAAFDVVSIAFGLRNLQDRQAGIREMARALDSGGRLLILEFAPPAHGLFGRLFRLYLDLTVPFLGLALAGSPQAYRYLSRSILDFHTPSEIGAMIERAGVRYLGFRPLMFGAVCLYRAVKD